jgi:hypothetical protein
MKFGVLNVRSAGNKSAQLCDLVNTSRYDIFVAIETWHEGRESASHIATTPPGYQCVERARPPPEGVYSGQPHGGVCVFYRQGMSASVKTVTSSDTFEQLATLFTSTHDHSLVVAVYRPGSQTTK